jgi:hypothetical protein
MSTNRFVSRGAVVVACLSFGLLSACGGGGTGSPPLVLPPAPPAPPAPTAQINGSNYLDAAAIGTVGRNRALELAGQLDLSFSLGLISNFTSANFGCPSGGTAALIWTSRSANTLTFTDCSYPAMLFKSGSIAVSNLETITSGTPPNAVLSLSRGTYRVLDLVTRALPGDGVDQTYNASVEAARQTDTSVTLTGLFGVLRNGRTDGYAGLTLNVNKPAGTIVATGMSFEASSPRFPVQPLRVTSSEGTNLSVRVAAPDTSYVRVTVITPAAGTSPAQLRFEVFATGTATSPTVSQTYADNDPQLLAAVGRALQ